MQINFIEHKAVNLVPYLIIAIAVIGISISSWLILQPYMSLKEEISVMEADIQSNQQAEADAIKLEKRVTQQQQLTNRIDGIEGNLMGNVELMDTLHQLMPTNSVLSHFYYTQGDVLKISISASQYADYAAYNQSLLAQPFISDVRFNYLEEADGGDSSAAFQVELDNQGWLEVIENDR
ncbi:PilN domain-containing protein [Gracilibacillus caseinilyticus]|uniref:PilN domain-containing protein n=1 Tax=Gracilibacillus caseinilyticus TaxID=2932256 RepID=A0ABY4EUH7_9BACI|nr:PilN domain-containing protein [Gracilibacillus caseinilyticus]UOQ47294.1 PilN domain-containing protein [Gracilibacillus caseinilyticus]